MRKQIILIATLLALGAGFSMNADARDWRKGKHGHKAHVHHHHHHYRSHRRGHRPRGYRHDYRSYHPAYYSYSGYRTRYYVPHRRVYVYGPPPPGVSFEYYRPSAGLWISVGF